MASDHLKSYERSDRQKHDVICNKNKSESIMKFSSKQLESPPPPKPPRRRYSDQLSAASLGTYASNRKHSEGNSKFESKLKEEPPKPAYLSLPVNLTCNRFNEFSDTPVSPSPSLNLSDQLKHSKENHSRVKNTAWDLTLPEIGMKQAPTSNKLNGTEKLRLINQQSHYDHVFEHEYSFDKLSRNSFCSNKVFLTDRCGSKNLQPFYKDCHRRHHSDPIISLFNLQNDSNSQKFEQEQCCDSVCSATRKENKFCGYTESCACCKKSYLIMQEIKILKEINEKLWQHLCSVQSYVENMRKKTYDDSADVSISGVLSSIYYAQRAKDCAMEERLRIALEERDTALLELEDLMQFMTKGFDYTDGEKEAEKDIKELVTEIGCTLNPTKLLQHQRRLLAQIHKLKESKQDSFSKELKQIVIERDNALDKVRKLEEEVKDLKLSYDIWHSDNKHWEFTIFDILNQLMHQRDTILSKIDYGLDIGNIIYRPPTTGKLESLEHQNASPFESRSKTIESIKSHQSFYLSDYKQKHSFGTSDEVVTLKEEILLLNKTLESEIKKREQAEGKCVRLERLIHILRKKLNGQNVGVPV